MKLYICHIATTAQYDYYLYAPNILNKFVKTTPCHFGLFKSQCNLRAQDYKKYEKKKMHSDIKRGETLSFSSYD